jgi:hypothetical protein
VGTRGPVPKRSEDRIRRNEPEVATTIALTDGEVHIPVPDPLWHPIARQLWDSLSSSGQSKFYESSDWAMAFSLMDDLSYYKSANKRSGQMLASILSAMSTLLVTEGDRRRVGIELARRTSEELESAGVAEMKHWQQRLAR